MGRLLADELISHMQNIYLIRTCTPEVKGGFFFFTQFLHTKIRTQNKDKIIMSYLIALSKDVASLGVTQDHPVHTAVLDHRRAAHMV